MRYLTNSSLQCPRMHLQFSYLYDQIYFRKVFEREMLIRTNPATLPDIVCELIINSQIIEERL